jgi:hypothetical protein
MAQDPHHLGFMESYPGQGAGAPHLFGMPDFTLAGCARAAPPAFGNSPPTSAYPRTRYRASASTAGSSMTIRHTVANMQPYGLVSGRPLGGFLFHCVFNISDVAVVDDVQFFLGLTTSTAALANSNPTGFTNCIGLGFSSNAPGAYNLFYGGSSAQTPLVLSSIPRANTEDHIIDFKLASYKDAGKIAWAVQSFGNSGEFRMSGEINSGGSAVILPQVGTFLNSFSLMRGLYAAASPTTTLGVDIHRCEWRTSAIGY